MAPKSNDKPRYDNHLQVLAEPLSKDELRLAAYDHLFDRIEISASNGIEIDSTRCFLTGFIHAVPIDRIASIRVASCHFVPQIEGSYQLAAGCIDIHSYIARLCQFIGYPGFWIAWIGVVLH